MSAKDLNSQLNSQLKTERRQLFNALNNLCILVDGNNQRMPDSEGEYFRLNWQVGIPVYGY